MANENAVGIIEKIGGSIPNPWEKQRHAPVDVIRNATRSRFGIVKLGDGLNGTASPLTTKYEPYCINFYEDVGNNNHSIQTIGYIRNSTDAKDRNKIGQFFRHYSLNETEPNVIKNIGSFTASSLASIIDVSVIVRYTKDGKVYWGPQCMNDETLGKYTVTISEDGNIELKINEAQAGNITVTDVYVFIRGISHIREV